MKLFTWPSPNARRVTIMLEECDLAYDVTLVDLVKGEQRAPEFLALNPNGTVPVLEERSADGHLLVRWTQSGAILMHLARTLKRFMPTDEKARAAVEDAYYFVLTDIAAAAVATFLSGRNGFPDASNMFSARLRSFLENADRRLSGRDYLAGDYSIADIALYPIIVLPVAQTAMSLGAPLGDLAAWRERIGARPAVERGMKVGQN